MIVRATELDVPFDELMPLAVAPEAWPARADGSHPHYATLCRYATDGVAGVVLRTIRVPGVGRVTHRSWIRDFIVGVNSKPEVA
jgi:hypothetical protein